MQWIARSLYLACVAFWLLALAVVTARPAYAYVDPGSGLFALQVIGSALLGFGYLVRARIRRLFERFTHTSKGAQAHLGIR